MRHSLVLVLLPLLAACGSTTGSRVASTALPKAQAPTRTSAVPAPRPSVAAPARGPNAPRVMNLPGLEGVIGAGVQDLQRQFGTARLDVFEGDARKLQFSGEACILDVYLYPPSPGAAPTATYVDARRASDGLDVDRAACVTALKRR